jgi:HD-GYP domain-containing protein (c-di-GMP phosphodiesterase class II)
VRVSLRLIDLLAGLSRLADLGFGMPAGESLRSCALATLLAEELDLAGDLRAAMYTTLLHHVGCTGYAHEITQAIGDDLAMNTAAGRTNLLDRRDMFATFLPTLTRGRPVAERALLAVRGALVAGERFGTAYTTATCEVGRRAAQRLELPDAVQTSVYHVYEFWQGGGAPAGLAGDDIPVASRLARLTGVAVLFDTLGGVAAATAAIRQRSGGMLDPSLAAYFVDHADRLLGELNAADPRATVLNAEPEHAVRVPDTRLVDVAAVFGDLADLKSPYTHGHASGVAALARTAGTGLGLARAEVDDLEVAALLHDVGRVAVSNRVWEKAGPLTDPEWEQVRLHAYHSERILAGSARLAALAPVVGMHHERLDRSGYHRGCGGADLPRSARILAAADAYQAMTRHRPHRPALRPDQARQQVLDDARRGALDPDAVSAVLAAAGHGTVVTRREPPAGLTDREVEVLTLVAEGCSNAQIGQRLGISRRTAEHHVQHVYAKLGTSSRAAAALFAMEHDLLA